MISQLLSQCLARHGKVGKRLCLLLGLALLLLGCSNGGESGDLSQPVEPNPQLEQEAIHNLLELYRTARIQEDIDRLQEILQPDHALPQGSRIAPQRTLRQENETILDAEAFRLAMSEAFRTRAILDVQNPAETARIADDRLSALFHKYCHSSGGQKRNSVSLGAIRKP